MNEVTGYIADQKTNTVLENIAGTLMMVDFDGNIILQPVQLTSGTYYAYTDQNPFDRFLVFHFPGYKTKNIRFADAEVNPDIYLEKSSPLLTYAALMLVVYIIIYNARKKGKVGKLSTGDVIPFLFLAGGVVAFSIIRKILEGLGLWDSKDTKDLDQAADDPNAFWNPYFWMSKPANVPWTYAITESTARQWNKDLKDAFGAFNDCESCAIAIMKRCRTQSNASFMSYIFNQDYGQDLLTYLRGGIWPQDRLSDADVNTINAYISKLPKY